MQRSSRWCLVLPVKRLAVAKRRLGPPYGRYRESLALAFALDTTAAALRSPLVVRVQAVTDDPAAAEALRAAGGAVTADVPDAGLNAALHHGAALAAEAVPGARLGTIAADLPALLPAELTAALAAAAGYDRAYVPDAPGTGTTLLLARDAARLAPRFGVGSAARHAASGAVEVGTELATLRRDVDRASDLAAALDLGVGPATRAVLEACGLDRRRGSVGGVQATVRTFDPVSRSGTVLLDDGTELRYDSAAFDAGDVRLLRVGQRVRIEVHDDGGVPWVTYLTIATLPDRRS